MNNNEIMEINTTETEIVNTILITIYFIFLLTSGLSIVVLLNNYIENDYYRLKCNVKVLLYNINDKFDIFDDKIIDTMDIKKMNEVIDNINRETITSDSDSDVYSEDSCNDVYSPFGPVLIY